MTTDELRELARAAALSPFGGRNGALAMVAPRDALEAAADAVLQAVEGAIRASALEEAHQACMRAAYEWERGDPMHAAGAQACAIRISALARGAKP